MNVKVGLVKKAIKWTPKGLITWVANKQLKGIAEITGIDYDLDTRKAHVKTLLAGEPEPIDVAVDGFCIIHDGSNYHFVLQQAESNKPWLNTIFSKVTGKAWKIPVPPQYASHFQLVAELLKPLDAPAEK